MDSKAFFADIGGMTDPVSFEGFLRQLTDGGQSASAEVFARFAERLILLARSRLSAQLLQKMDPEDVVQSVFRSFFRRQGAGQFDFDNWGGLWGLLVTMTIRKCGRRADKFFAARRDIRREIPPVGSLDDSIRPIDMPANEPTPAEAATLADFVEQLMGSLDERGRTLRLQGCSVAEIGDQIGRTSRTVQRILDRISTRLKRLAGDLEDASGLTQS